ncbi:unnamed protein product [Penicillium viridicatum]
MLITDYMTRPDITRNPEWDPIKFEPQEEWFEILAQPIQCIRAVCLEPPDLFHPNIWVLFLSTSEVDMTSIKLECQPSYHRRTIVVLHGSKAKILFQKIPDLYLRAHGISALFVLNVNPGFTVRDIHRMIVRNNRHKYEIDEEGWNIRTWAYDQIALFNEHGIFANQDEVEVVKDAFQKRWPEGGPNPLYEGAYYG